MIFLFQSKRSGISSLSNISTIIIRYHNHCYKVQHVLQAGLASGMSTTEGVHSSKAPKVSPNFDGLKYVLPQSFIPDLKKKKKKQVTFRGANDDVQTPYIIWGAWAWGDSAT